MSTIRGVNGGSCPSGTAGCGRCPHPLEEADGASRRHRGRVLVQTSSRWRRRRGSSRRVADHQRVRDGRESEVRLEAAGPRGLRRSATRRGRMQPQLDTLARERCASRPASSRRASMRLVPLHVPRRWRASRAASSATRLGGTASTRSPRRREAWVAAVDQRRATARRAPTPGRSAGCGSSGIDAQPSTPEMSAIAWARLRAPSRLDISRTSADTVRSETPSDRAISRSVAPVDEQERDVDHPRG